MNEESALTLPFDTFSVSVVRSTKRRRSVSASMVGDVLRVSIPNWMSRAEEQEAVDEMVRRFKRRIATFDIDLMQRARSLAKTHSLQVPDVIEWGENLTSVWGLCTPALRHVRISTRLVGAPSWVLDYVIVHELAHLVVEGHDARFHAIVQRYPLAERARGFLMAVSFGDASAPGRTDESPLTPP